MPIQDFIAQLRTYVIAMGLSPMVVDCVDNLRDVDELEKQHETELQENENRVMVETKDIITSAVERWVDEHGDLSEAQINSLLNAVKYA